jgi:hypothetical protein
VRPVRSRFGQLRGMLHDPKCKPVSVEAMNAAIEREHGRR